MLNKAFFVDPSDTVEVPVTMDGSSAVFVLHRALDVKRQGTIAASLVSVSIVNGKPVPSTFLDISATNTATLAAYIKGVYFLDVSGNRGELVSLTSEQIGTMRGDVADMLNNEIIKLSPEDTEEEEVPFVSPSMQP